MRCTIVKVAYVAKTSTTGGNSMLIIFRRSAGGFRACESGYFFGFAPGFESLIEQTFSSDFRERKIAVKQIGEMGKSAAPAIPFLMRLFDEQDLDLEASNGATMWMTHWWPSGNPRSTPVS